PRAPGNYRGLAFDAEQALALQIVGHGRDLTDSAPTHRPRWGMATPAHWSRHLPADVDPGSIDLLARRSLPAAWATNWRNAPDRPALRDVDGTWCTGGQLLERTEQAAGRLAAAGLVAGDRVGGSGASSVALSVADCAAFPVGRVVGSVQSACT